MNQNFLDTIYLFSCGANGAVPEIENKLDFKEIYTISQSQGIWETVFLAIISLHENKPDIIPQKLYEQWLSNFIVRCGMQYRKYALTHEILKKLNEKGVETCVLKGESLSRFYHTPIARTSSDFDILINPKKLDLCLNILRENGFKIGEIVYESHQIECVHPIVGLVEIHIMMYGKKTEDVCFNNEVKYSEPYINVESEDGTIYQTLGITDNFLYLLLHFIKHFLSAGVGIRQLLDVLLYVKNNYNLIDWERANRAISNLGFKKMFDCMVAIGIKYFMFPKDLIKVQNADEILVGKVFDDMMLGGVFGHNDSKRQGFYDLYLNERCKKIKNKNYEVYRNKRKLTRLFPNREFMSINFPYVTKLKILLPVAWVHRIIKGILPQKAKPVSTEHSERLKLLQELAMI